MSIITNNISASKTANNLNNHYDKLKTSNRRISSGLRIDKASDDPAGLAIRELLRAESAGLRQGARNANDGISMVKTADGALQGTNKLLTRMKELATQASTGTYSADQRKIIDKEYQAMAAEVTRISESTEFNGTKLLDGSLSGTHDGTGLNSTGEIKIHVGTGNDASQDHIDVAIDDTSAAALGVGNIGTAPNVAGSSIATQSSAQDALVAIDAAIASVSQTSANLGATQNRLESVVASTNIQGLNLTAAESRTSDADIAKESTKLVREQLLTKSSIEMLSLANNSPNMMMQLISKQI